MWATFYKNKRKKRKKKHHRQFSLVTSPTNVITYYGYQFHVKTSVIVFSQVFGYVNLNLEYYNHLRNVARFKAQ